MTITVPTQVVASATPTNPSRFGGTGQRERKRDGRCTSGTDQFKLDGGLFQASGQL